MQKTKIIWRSVSGTNIFHSTRTEGVHIATYVILFSSNLDSVFFSQVLAWRSWFCINLHLPRTGFL